MRLTRFERATCRSAICCSIQLSYNLSALKVTQEFSFSKFASGAGGILLPVFGIRPFGPFAPHLGHKILLKR